MRILCLTIGTRGDLEQMASLASALQRRGHTVVIASSLFHAPSVQAKGLDFLPVGAGGLGDLQNVLRSLSAIPDLWKRGAAFVERWVMPQWRAARELIVEWAMGFDVFCSNLHIVLERSGQRLPCVSLLYDLPDPSADLRNLVRSSGGAALSLRLAALPMSLIGESRACTSLFHFVGFFVPDENTGDVDDELSDFLSRGPAPVLLTMGSMEPAEGRRLVDRFQAALEQAGRRGIVVGGWSGLHKHVAGPGILARREVPYGRVFSRCACIVHHGSTGATAFSLHAGAPSVVVPFLGSQRELAASLERQKLCTGVFPIEAMDAGAMARAIRIAVDDSAVKTACERWADRIRRERGVDRAAEIIERFATEDLQEARVG